MACAPRRDRRRAHRGDAGGRPRHARPRRAFAEPVLGRFVSVPEHGEPLLNRLVMRQGRAVEAGAVGRGARERTLRRGPRPASGRQRWSAVLKGNRRVLRIVGIALCPEFIYSLGPGALMPDDKRFGVMWMDRDTLAAAFDLQESFNSVTLDLERGVEPGTGDPSRRPHPRTLRRHRRDRARRPDVELVRDERDRAARDDVEDPAGDLPGRLRLPHQHGARRA